MPCWHCSRRQTDPARGPSLWRRGVLGGEQILVCPECSREVGWDAQLDSCMRCGSRRLVKALGEVLCRACGAVGEAGGAVSEMGAFGPADARAGSRAVRSAGRTGAAAAPIASSRDEGLAQAVEEALRRRWGA